MKTKSSKKRMEDLMFQDEVLNDTKLLMIKGGHCEDDEEDEQTAVVLDNGSGG